MAEGRQREAWSHTANVMRGLWDVVRYCGHFKRPPKALEWRDVYPFAAKEKPLPVPPEMLGRIFGKARKKK